MWHAQTRRECVTAASADLRSLSCACLLSQASHGIDAIRAAAHSYGMGSGISGDSQHHGNRHLAARTIGRSPTAGPVVGHELESASPDTPAGSEGLADTPGGSEGESSEHRNLPRPLRRTDEEYRHAFEAERALALALAEIDAVLARLPEGGEREIEAAAVALANQRRELVRALLDVIAERGDRQHPLPSVTALSEVGRLEDGVSKASDQFGRPPRWKKAVVAARRFATAVGRMVGRYIQSADLTLAVPLADGTIVSWTIRIRGPRHDVHDGDPGHEQPSAGDP
jgi:hypothetical protein